MADLVSLIGIALSLDRSALAVAATAPGVTATVLMIAFLSGASQMLGQSVVLFANRVSRRRFVVCLAIAGLVYVAGLAGWGVAIWLTARYGFGLEIPTGAITFALCVGQAPLLFGFFSLIPYLGMSLHRVLIVYSLLVVLAALSAVPGIQVWQAALLAAIGWGLRAGLDRALMRPLAGVQIWLWRASTGRSMPIMQQGELAALTANPQARED